ncbi:MAG: CHAD domain-containing protein [Sphingomonadaceae bacterium]
MEVELKLLLDPADNKRLIQHPLIAAHASGAVRSAQLSAHYFDTPDLHLLHHGAGLRVRKMDGIWIQTMKAGGSVQNGLHQRHEWEGPVARPWPQLGKLRKLMAGQPAWQAVLDAPSLKDRLDALFSVQVERRTWDLDVDGNQIELVLDHGTIERHGQQVPINEIELELKAGQPIALFQFAQQLQHDLPLHLSNSSKAERGYALCVQSGTVPVKARALALAPDDSVAAVWLAVLGNCLDHIQRNEAAVIHGDNAESLHQMRVGVRRLRSAFKLFDAAAPCPPALRDDIDWLGSELGTARDWDVLSEATLGQLSGHLGQELVTLQALLQEQVRSSRQSAAQALLSQRYTRLQLALGAWMQQLAQMPDDSGDAQALAQPAGSFAQQVLLRLHKSMLKRADRSVAGDPASVHRLRIAGKRSRYALEFFQSLYRHGSTQRYLDALSTLQDRLGAHNDLVVAERLLRELQQQRPEAAAALAYVRGYLQAQRERDATDIGAVRKSVHALHLPQRA